MARIIERVSSDGDLLTPPVGHQVDWAGVGAREAGDLVPGGDGDVVSKDFKDINSSYLRISMLK